MRRRTWVAAGIVAALAIGGGTAAAVLAVSRQSAAAAPMTQTVAASLETMEQTVQASGTLTPAVQENVDFAASGTVTSVAVAAGDTVEKGQRLASVDSLQTDAELLQARADLADAEAQLASAREDADGSAASNAQIAAREAAVDVAGQSVTEAEEAAAGVTLLAPVAGLVTSVNLEVGDAVTGASGSGAAASSGSAAGGTAAAGTGSGSAAGGSSTSASSTSGASASQFTIVGTDDWTVSVSLGETEIGSVELDDQVELETADGTQLFGIVSEIGALPSTSSGTAAFPVTVDITGETEGLFDGTSVTATIITERRTGVLTVQSAAVTTADDGTTTVTKVGSNGEETEQVVAVGEVSGGLTEITDGLQEGDLVVVTAFTPGEGNSGADPGEMPGFGGGEMPDFGGEMPNPGGGEMPGFGGTGGGRQ